MGEEMEEGRRQKRQITIQDTSPHCLFIHTRPLTLVITVYTLTLINTSLTYHHLKFPSVFFPYSRTFSNYLRYFPERAIFFFFSNTKSSTGKNRYMTRH